MKFKPEYHKLAEENKKLEVSKTVPMNFLSCSLLPKQQTKLVKPKIHTLCKAETA